MTHLMKIQTEILCCNLRKVSVRFQDNFQNKQLCDRDVDLPKVIKYLMLTENFVKT